MTTNLLMRAERDGRAEFVVAKDYYWHMNIAMSDLLKGANQAFEHFDETEQREFEISRNSYWWIDSKVVYNVLRDPTPKDLTVRSLRSDWMSVTACLDDENALADGALTKLGVVFRAIGENSRW